MRDAKTPGGGGHGVDGAKVSVVWSHYPIISTFFFFLTMSAKVDFCEDKTLETLKLK